MSKRSIINGRLDFKNSRSFNRMRHLFEQRIENHYKDDVLFSLDELSEEDGSSISIPKQISEGNEKTWNNTVQLLKFMSQYAISGKVQAWITQNGKVLLSQDIEPQGDKKAIINYKKGLELLKEGKTTEAIEAYDKALDSFEKHSTALEKRGYAKFLLQNYDESLKDFTDSIEFYPFNPEAYIGRSRVYIELERYDEAIEDLISALKYSVPVQSLFWTARRLKAKAHIRLKQYDKAKFELKFFVKRNYSEDEANQKWKRAALLQQTVLIQDEDHILAKDHLKAALNQPSETGISDSEIRVMLERLESNEKLDIENHNSYL